MNREDAERVLAKAGDAPDDQFSLFEAALACALHENPDRGTTAPPAPWPPKRRIGWPNG